MDQYSLIDRDTLEVWEHAEDHPKVFICDKRIAPSIALLNKKGYKTLASCGGHYRIEWDGQKDTMIYVLFDKDYKFNSIPEGFILTDTHSIESYTELFYKDKLKNRGVLEKELDEKANKLYIWVESLPVNKERND